MATDKADDPAEPEHADAASRRRFLQGTVATAAGALLPGAAITDAEAASSKPNPGNGKGNLPNILILMCDENRYPPVYESSQTQAYRRQFLSLIHI